MHQNFCDNIVDYVAETDGSKIFVCARRINFWNEFNECLRSPAKNNLFGRLIEPYGKYHH